MKSIKEEWFYINNKYITCGVNEKVPPFLQLLMWEMINQLPVDKDYLQVFYLSEKNGRQMIKHIQEVPEHIKEYVLKVNSPITEKIFVIDDEECSAMMLSSEY